MTAFHHNPLSLIERLEAAAAMNGPHSTVALTVAHIRALEVRALAAEAKLAEAREILQSASAWFERVRPTTDEANDYLNNDGWDDMSAIADRAARFMEGNGDG